MSDNTNSPGGGLPPKPSEAAKVQPKKETVRINLPPKPTASPTIKLPTLPPSASAAPAGATAAPMVSVPTAAPTATAAAPKAVPAPATSAPAARAATAAVSRPAATSVGPAPTAMRAPMVAAVSPVDKILAVAAAVISLAALGSVIYIWQFVLAPALQVQ